MKATKAVTSAYYRRILEPQVKCIALFSKKSFIGISVLGGFSCPIICHMIVDPYD